MVDVFPGGSGIINPSKQMNPIIDQGVKLTPDRKYQKLYQLNSEKKVCNEKFVFSKINNVDTKFMN